MPLNFDKAVQHVAASADGSNLRIFVDGVMEALFSASAVSCTATTSSIGYDALTSNQYFPGVIDDLRVSTIAKYTTPTYTPPKVPVAYNNEFLLFSFNDATSSGSVTTTTAVPMTYTSAGSPTYVTSPFP